jgi:hypothetical protein
MVQTQGEVRQNFVTGFFEYEEFSVSQWILESMG